MRAAWREVQRRRAANPLTRAHDRMKRRERAQSARGFAFIKGIARAIDLKRHPVHKAGQECLKTPPGEPDRFVPPGACAVSPRSNWRGNE